MNELRTIAWVGLVICVLAVASLVAAHERHYSKRRLILLEAEVRALRQAFIEDRTV